MLLSRSLKLAVLGPITLCSALIAGGCDRQSATEAQPQASASGSEAAGTLDRSHKGSALPDLVLKDSAGKQLRLADLKGRPVLVNLWATWCAPCIAELPTLDRLAAAQGGPRVVTVSQDMGQPEKVAAFLKDRGLAHLEAWLDPQNDLAFHYQVSTLPTSLLYDAAGREVWRFTGGNDWASEKSAALLKEAE